MSGRYLQAPPQRKTDTTQHHVEHLLRMLKVTHFTSFKTAHVPDKLQQALVYKSATGVFLLFEEVQL